MTQDTHSVLVIHTKSWNKHWWTPLRWVLMSNISRFQIFEPKVQQVLKSVEHIIFFLIFMSTFWCKSKNCTQTTCPPPPHLLYLAILSHTISQFPILILRLPRLWRATYMLFWHVCNSSPAQGDKKVDQLWESQSSSYPAFHTLHEQQPIIVHVGISKCVLAWAFTTVLPEHLKKEVYLFDWWQETTNHLVLPPLNLNFWSRWETHWAKTLNA